MSHNIFLSYSRKDLNLMRCSLKFTYTDFAKIAD
jgi:hypothetical protein